METGEWVGNFQNLSKYWTTCNRKETEKRLKYCISRDMNVIIVLQFLQNIIMLNNRPFVLCNLLLIYVSYVVT